MLANAAFTLFTQILLVAAMAAGAGALLSIPLSEMFIAAGLVIVMYKKRWLPLDTPPWLLLFVQVVLGISVGAMTAIALLLGMEPAFVMINHALRLLLLYSLPAMLKKQLEALRGR